MGVERTSALSTGLSVTVLHAHFQAQYANTRASAMAPSTEVFMSRTLWTAVVWDYFRRIKRDYADLFKCPICGTMETAPILTMDGTALSCAAMLAKPSVPGGAVGPIHERIPPYPDRRSKTGVSLEDRCLIRNVALRTAILSMSKSFSSDQPQIQVQHVVLLSVFTGV